MADPVRGNEQRGFGFPITKGREGYWPRRNSAALRQTSILMVLGTVPGERVGEPAFGSRLHELVFAPNDITTSQLARQFTISALAKYDPFLKVVNVAVEQVEDGLTVFIDYIDLGGDTAQEPRRVVYPIRRG